MNVSKIIIDDFAYESNLCYCARHHVSFSYGASATITCIIYEEYVHVDVELAEFNVREPAQLFKIRSSHFLTETIKIAMYKENCMHAHVYSFRIQSWCS